VDKTYEIDHSETTAVRIQVPPEAREDLLEFLRRADCRAEADGDATVVVEVPAAHNDEQARMEVDLYLKAWQASHPEVDAHLLDAPRSRVADEAPAAD
jgi:hypothetical protein